MGGVTLRIDKYLLMWLQVAFYSILISLGAYAMHLVTLTDVLKGFLPVSTGMYWYFSAYTGLFFLRPFLNKLVDTMSEMDIKKFAAVLIALFSAFGSILGRNADSFGMKNGYSVLWLVLLYVLGSSLKKTQFARKIHTKQILLVIAGSYVITFCSVVVLPIAGKQLLHRSIPRGVLWSYCSPTIIVMAVCTLLLFAKMKISSEAVSRWVSKLAMGAFGVYLIHSNPVFDRIVLENRFVSVGNQPIWIMIPAIAVIALVIFVFCLIVELARILLFKCLKIEQMTKRLVQCLSIEKK